MHERHKHYQARPKRGAERHLTPWTAFKLDINKFLRINFYKGYGRFHLVELRKSELIKQVRPQSRAYEVIIKELGEESLADFDRKWEAGLYEVGMRWETELRLPYWYFEK